MRSALGYIPGILTGKLRHLIFFVTNRCNARCSHCFYWTSLNASVRELSLDEIELISNTIDSFPMLLVSGGEPTLRADLPEICRIFTEKNGVTRVAIPTNGLLPEKIMEVIRRTLVRCGGLENLDVGLSLDGFKETHDRMRGVPGSFDGVMRTCELLRELGDEFSNLSISIVSVVTDSNYCEVDRLLDYVHANMLADRHVVEPVRGEPKDSSLHAPPYTDFAKLAEKSTLYTWGYRRRSLKFSDIAAQRMMQYTYHLQVKTLEERRWLIPCTAGRYIAVIEPNGDLRLCELTRAIGNLRDYNYDFRRLWESEQADAMRQAIASCYCTHGCFTYASLMDPTTLAKAAAHAI